MFFLKKNLEGISPFRGITDTPVLDTLVTSPLGFKARLGNHIRAWRKRNLFGQYLNDWMVVFGWSLKVFCHHIIYCNYLYHIWMVTKRSQAFQDPFSDV